MCSFICEDVHILSLNHEFQTNSQNNPNSNYVDNDNDNDNDNEKYFILP